MFKSLLNNKLTVLALCGIAMGLVAFNMAPLLFGSGDDFADTGAAAFDDDWLEEEIEIATARLELRSVNASAVTWNDSPRRDPFGPVPDDFMPNVGMATDGSLDAAPLHPRLDALVAGTQSRLAIIDGEIIVEGQQIEGYRVLDIGPDGVVLHDALNDTITLRVSER